MIKKLVGCFAALGLATGLLAGPAKTLRAADPPASALVFRDVAESAGLLHHVAGIQGHAAGWGDVDGDGWADLYVATFHKKDGKSNQLFRNVGGTFTLDEQVAPRISTRATGALFADLDNDGDLDLYVSSMPQPKSELLGCTLFRNDDGKLIDVSENNGACPKQFGGRSAAVVDYDGDGLLDLLVGEDPLPGYNGSKTHATRLFRNRGQLQFEDVSREVGLPENTPGLGVAAADVNNDTWPDIFVAANSGGNVLLVNDGKGKFRSEPRDTFDWEGAGGDNMVCGVAFGDVNRDGRLDMVIGPHFQSPWIEPIGPRLYLNESDKRGVKFTDVSSSVGLVPLPMKSPHVEIQDFDNDGWPDISTTVVKFRGNEVRPVIFRNLQGTAGKLKFAENALALNDFPTDEDRAVKGTGKFFTKMLADRKVVYTAPGPTCDFDQDGRLDMFLPSWWPESPSLLLRNETESGNWLQVQVEGPDGVNRQGIGARINVYREGKVGDEKALLGCGEIASGYGYASCQQAVSHFGLGAAEKVDVEVVLPHGRGRLERRGVAANQRITLGE